MPKTNDRKPWPTFRGRPLTAKEMASGIIVTRLYGDEYITSDSDQIPRNQLWVGRGGRILLELRFGLPPFETNGGVSTLSATRFQELATEARVVCSEIDAQSGDILPNRTLSQIVFKRGTIDGIAN